MFRAMVRAVERIKCDLGRMSRGRGIHAAEPESAAPANGVSYRPLQRVTLTDEVNRNFFREYEVHRQSKRGHEETGWVLLGLREETEAIVLATLPAGAERDAGVAHVQFNSSAQALASRIIRQTDRRLTMLGVVHTHPGSLRHPSDGDFRGDSQWVTRLRGEEGIFGIGTADEMPEHNALFARHPKSNLQAFGPYCFSWYSLRAGETSYRPLTLNLTLGPDLAHLLHSVWMTLEAHADRLERLMCQQVGTRFQVIEGNKSPALAVTIPMAEPQRAIRVVMEGDSVRYYIQAQGDLQAIELRETHVDRGVYMLLAEMAAKA